MKKQFAFKNMEDMAEHYGLPPSRGLEAEIKAILTKAIIQQMNKQNLTHAEIAEKSEVSRTTITGIVNGSLTKVTIDRLLKILGAIGMSVDVKVKRAG